MKFKNTKSNILSDVAIEMGLSPNIWIWTCVWISDFCKVEGCSDLEFWFRSSLAITLKENAPNSSLV